MFLEDDIEAWKDPHLLEPLLKTLNQLDPRWDILFTDPNTRHWKTGEFIYPFSMDCSHPKVKNRKLKYFLKRKLLTSELVRIYGRWATHSMIISKRGLEKLYAYFNSIELWAPIDVMIHHVPNLREYASTSPIVTSKVEDGISDTEHNH